MVVQFLRFVGWHSNDDAAIGVIKVCCSAAYESEGALRVLFEGLGDVYEEFFLGEHGVRD